MSEVSKTTEHRHWVGHPSYGVPCDAMGEGGGCSLCQELESMQKPSDENRVAVTTGSTSYHWWRGFIAGLLAMGWFVIAAGTIARMLP